MFPLHEAVWKLVLRCYYFVIAMTTVPPQKSQQIKTVTHLKQYMAFWKESGQFDNDKRKLDEKERGNIYISCDAVTLCHKISLVFVSNNMCYTGNLQHKLAPPCLIVLLIWALSHTLAAKITLICTYYISGQNLIWNSMLLIFLWLRDQQKIIRLCSGNTVIRSLKFWSFIIRDLE